MVTAIIPCVRLAKIRSLLRSNRLKGKLNYGSAILKVCFIIAFAVLLFIHMTHYRKGYWKCIPEIFLCCAKYVCSRNKYVTNKKEKFVEQTKVYTLLTLNWAHTLENWAVNRFPTYPEIEVYLQQNNFRSDSSQSLKRLRILLGITEIITAFYCFLGKSA